MNIRITEAAREKILEELAKVGSGSFVACVGWVKSGVKMWADSRGNEISAPIATHWGLGFHDRASLPAEQIADVKGIPLLIDESLDGKTLDFREGEFYVR